MIREVKTENGWVRGIQAADPRITSFKGIPFAAPPIGENRWRAPMPCKDWDGVLDASRFAPISMQDTPGMSDDIYCREWHVDPEIAMSEDCLYLNVWTGAKKADEKQPVVVWFFGGVLQWGYPSEMEFDGERLARRGVVVVTINYRINVFGFLSHPEITKEAPEAPANFGLLDQQAAVKWVKRNIAAFGGDPDNITIAGQSAGGGSVLNQLTSPKNEGLFQKAVVMSGIIRSPYEQDVRMIPTPLSQAQERGKEFFRLLGVETLEEARALEAAYIVEKYSQYIQEHPLMMTVVDDIFCLGDPLKQLMQGKCMDIPMMAGNTEDEFLYAINAETQEELKEKAQLYFGDRADAFLRFSEVKQSASSGGYAAVSGVESVAKAIFAKRKADGSKQNYYYYQFATDIPGWDNPGTFHSVDLWFFFETLAKCWRPFVGRHYDLSRHMCNYWANFIKTGDPNGLDADGTPMPKWSPYLKEEPAGILFGKEGAVPVHEKEKPFTDFLMDMVTSELQSE